MASNSLVRVLVTGGARSGKSRYALSLARPGERWYFVATATAGDAEMADRIKRHQAERSDQWTTIEEPFYLSRVLRDRITDADGVVVDCITFWVSQWLLRFDEPTSPEYTRERFAEEVADVLTILRKSDCRIVLVTNEVSSGVVPDSHLGREFRDLTGHVNQQLADAVDKVVVCICGRALELPRHRPEEGAPPADAPGAWWTGPFAAWTLLLSLPLPITLPPLSSARAVGWFPLVGIVPAVAAYAVASLGLPHDTLMSLLLAALVVLLQAALTGGLHWDALADAADGWAARHRGNAAMRRAMHDSAAGALGVLAVVALMLVQVSATSILLFNDRIVGFGGWLIAPVLGRWLMSIGCVAGRSAGPGLGASYVGQASVGDLLLASLWVALAVMAFADPAWWLTATVAALACGSTVLMMFHRRLGGLTGDVLGAAGMIAESAALVTLAMLVHSGDHQ